MPGYLVVRLLDKHGIFEAETFVLGDVEVRPAKFDTDDETKRLEESRIAAGVDKALSPVAMRIATVVEADRAQDADALASERFELALDLLDGRNFGLSRIALTHIGFIRDLATGTVVARPPPPSFGPFPTFRVRYEKWTPLELVQWVAIHQKDDLSSRWARSHRWSRLARLLGEDRQLRVLFRWFAVETLLRVAEEDDIVPWIAVFLGFPSKKMLSVGNPLLEQLKTIPNHRTWSKQVSAMLQRVRDFRNDTVHSGFRAQDIPRAELRDFNLLMTLAAPRVQNAVGEAITMGLADVVGLRGRVADVLARLPNWVNDVRGTVIYGLEHVSDLPEP